MPGRGGAAKRDQYESRRLRAFRRQHGLCWYCKRAMLEPRGPLAPYATYPLNWATWDHVVPTSRGGPDTAANKVLACYDCNQAKDDRTGEEFRRADLYLLALAEEGEVAWPPPPIPSDPAPRYRGAA